MSSFKEEQRDQKIKQQSNQRTIGDSWQITIPTESDFLMPFSNSIGQSSKEKKKAVHVAADDRKPSVTLEDSYDLISGKKMSVVTASKKKEAAEPIQKENNRSVQRTKNENAAPKVVKLEPNKRRKAPKEGQKTTQMGDRKIRSTQNSEQTHGNGAFEPKGKRPPGIKGMNPTKWFVLGLAVMVLLVVLISVISVLTNEEPAQPEPTVTPTVTQPPAPTIQREPYPEGTDPLTVGSITQLINKTHSLPQDYVPADLVQLDLPTLWDNFLRAEAAQALTELFEASEKDGVALICCSGYRSYEEQKAVFENESSLRGEAEAQMRTSLPGYSEHQSGLAMDVTCEAMEGTLEITFYDTPEGKWVAEHAHEYGFIIRYPDGMEKITGYTYEPWHLRYLGKAVAQAVHDSGLTYEAYLGMTE